MSLHKYPWLDDEISLIADNIEHPPRIVYKKYVEKFGQVRSFNAVKRKRLDLIDELGGVDKDLKEIGPARNTEANAKTAHGKTLAAFNVLAYAKAQFTENFAWKIYGNYGQNPSELLQLGSVAYNPLKDDLKNIENMKFLKKIMLYI